MELNEIETQILLDIYDMDINYGKNIKVNTYELNEEDIRSKKQEFASYLLKLKRIGYLEFDEDKAFSKGGWRNQKYRNNVIMIWPENIHISEKGINIVEEIKKTVFEKVKDKSIYTAKNIAEKVLEEFKDLTSKTIAEYFMKITKG